MPRFHGKHGQVSINGTAITGQSKWSLDMETDTAECSAFGDANKVYVQGLPDRKGAFSGFYDTDSISALVTSMDSTDPVTLRITPNTIDNAKFFEGPAWISVNVEGDIKDAAKASAKFVAGPGAAWTANL